MTVVRGSKKYIIRLLHVEDDESSRQLLKNSLTEIDPAIQVFSLDSKSVLSNGSMEHRFDCILVNHTMPQGAFDRLLDLKASDDIPFILINDRGAEEYDDDAFTPGKTFSKKHGIKTINYVVLATRIRHSLERNRIKKLYVDIAERSKDAIVVSVGTVAMFANQAAADLVGAVSPSELLGKDLLAWIKEEERPKLIQLISSSTQEKMLQMRPVEVTLRSDDGNSIAIEASISPVNYAGEPAFLTFMRSIDARKSYEKMLKALHDCAIRLNTASTQDEALNYTFEAMTNILEHRRCSVATIEEGYVSEYLTAGMGEEKLRLSLAGLGIITKAVRLNRTVLVQDTTDEPEYIEAAKGIDVKSKLVVPVALEGDVRVILSVERGELNGFSVEDVELLEILSSHLAQSLGMIDEIKERQASKDIYQLLGSK